MHDDKIPVPSYISWQPLKFQANVGFENDPGRQADASFLKHSKKSSSEPRNRNLAREVINTLLASAENDGELDDCVEKLLTEDISYNDLSSLTETDLKLMGIKNRHQQKELLEFLHLLPNQDLCYNSIINLPEAKNYNNNILNSAATHLETMKLALTVANYKLEVMPADDVIVGEKSFASRFVLEALSELKGVTDEIDAQLLELDEFVTGDNKSGLKNKVKRFSIALWILMGSIATGTLAAMWCLKFTK